MSLTDKKRAKVKELLNDRLSYNRATTWNLSKLIDNLVAGFPVVTFRPLQYRHLHTHTHRERDRERELLDSKTTIIILLRKLISLVNVQPKNNGVLTVLMNNVSHHNATSCPNIGLYADANFVMWDFTDTTHKSGIKIEKKTTEIGVRTFYSNIIHK